MSSFFSEEASSKLSVDVEWTHSIWEAWVTAQGLPKHPLHLHLKPSSSDGGSFRQQSLPSVQGRA